MSLLYQSLLRPMLFRLDPESAHRMALRLCALSGRSALLRKWVRSCLQVEDPRLAQTLAGIKFANPVGLAAGFDKNATAIAMLDSLGFGFVEVGSVSAYPSRGNAAPRLFRLPQDEAIVVNYGVPNDGADAVAARLLHEHCNVPLGINLVKTNDPDRPATDREVLGDYASAFAKLQGSAAYVTLNLSCPNSAKDRNYFDEVSRIDALLQRLADEQPRVPVFLKLKPTLSKAWLSELVDAAKRFDFVAGFGINLPAGKPPELRLATPLGQVQELPGAVSGSPVEGLINANLRLLYELVGASNRYRLVAAGGIFSAEDAYRKIRLGASLVQLYTAMVYRGPAVVKHILRGLVALLERDGFSHVSQAVGVDVTGTRS